MNATPAEVKPVRNPIKLGEIARDTITGFEGVVVADTQWLHGCRRLTIQPRERRDGKPVDPMSFDELQLERVSTQEAVAVGSRKRGGPRPEPQRR